MRRLRPAPVPLCQLSTSKLSAASFSTLILFLLICTTLSFAASPDRITGAIGSRPTVALGRSQHPKAQLQYDRGPVDPSLKLGYMSMLIAPSPSQQKALDELLAEQQNPASPLFHKWLTPQGYADRFGLSPNDLAKVIAWLTSQGFEIIGTGGGRNLINFSGTASQVQQAFGTEIHHYDVNGEKHIANSSPVMVPAELGGVITTLMGLHNFLPHPANRRASQAQLLHHDYYDGNFYFKNFLAPDDIATIYDIASLYKESSPIDGTGQKLAIVGQTDIFLDDINDFRSGFGLNTIPTSGANSCSVTTTGSAGALGLITSCNNATNLGYVLVGTDPGQAYPCGDLSEADLDVEWSGATARNAQIIYVNSPTTYDSSCTPQGSQNVFTALAAAIEPNGDPVGDGGLPPVAPVISMSYGACEVIAYDLESLLQYATGLGVTILNSSGDQGSAECDTLPPTSLPYAGAQYGLAVSYPASSQYVTGVGGTEITLADDSYPNPNPTYWSTTLGPNGGTALKYIPEIAWNDDEELASYCQDPASGDQFCANGNDTPFWVPLGTSATASQVQQDIWIAQGGGGASNCWYLDNSGNCLPNPQGGFAQPAYQQSLSISSAPQGVRWVPDVALLASADFPGYIWCTPVEELVTASSNYLNDYTSSCSTSIASAVNGAPTGDPTTDIPSSVIGGTSAASPIFAGIVALLNQYVISKGIQSEPGLGNINTRLYQLAATSSSPFHKVNTGDSMVYCQAGQPEGEPSGVICPSSGVFGFEASASDSKTGYNLVTGLGSVDVGNLLTVWAATSTYPTTTTVTSSLPTAPSGANVTFTATVTTTGTNAPTGTVTFYNGTTSIGTGTLSTVSGSQETTFTTSTLPVGADSITAVYGGDANNSSSTSAVLTETINAAVTTTTTLTPTPNPAGLGAQVNLSVTVTTTGTSTPTGNVTFSTGGVAIPGSAALSGTGTTASATLITTTLPVGADSITATYGGDANNSGSSGSATETITAPTFSFPSQPTTPGTVLSGQSTTSTFSVTPTGVGVTTFAANVTFACNGLPDTTVTCSFNTGQVNNPTYIAAGSTGPVTVTLTINTAGPNTSAGVVKGERRRAENRSPWLPLALPLAGIVMVGFAGRKISRHSAIAGLCASLVLLGLLAACGGGSSSGPPPVTVSVSPSSKTLYPNDSTDNWPAQGQSFSATVSNSTNTGVTWSLSTSASGVSCTSSSNPCGTISSSGAYTAPTIVAGLPGSVTVTATSQASSSATGSAAVTLTPTTVPGTYPLTVGVTEAGNPVNTNSFTLTVQ